MRDIKFRAKRIDNSEWIYGVPMKNDSRGVSVFYNSDVGTLRAEPVTPETVGQLTGIKDKNGQDIYEGDILDQSEFQEDDPCPYSVVFEDGSFRVKYANWKPMLKKPDFNLSQISLLNDVVIGNIHDNPELLS